MADRYETDLIVKAITEGFEKLASDVRAAGQSVEQASQAASKSGNNWTELNSILGVAERVYGKVKAAAQATYATLKEGAELQLTQQRFDNLSRSIGTTSDVLLGRMKEATDGMISNAQLIQNGTDIISLGLAKTEDQTVRLSNVVGQLGWDMSQVVLTMANDSTRRLDTLGLSIEDVTRRQKAWIAAGKSTGDAFDLAVIEAGEAKIKLLGNQANTSAGQLKMVEAAVQNMQDSFKKRLVEEYAESLEKVGGSAVLAVSGLDLAGQGLASFLGKLGGLATQGLLLNPTVANFAAQGARQQTADLQAAAAAGAVNPTSVDAQATQAMIARANQVRQANEDYTRQQRIMTEYAGTTEEVNRQLDALSVTGDRAAEANRRVKEETGLTVYELAKLGYSADEAGQYLEDMAEKERIAAEEARKLRAESGQAFNTAIGQYREGNYKEALVTPERSVTYRSNPIPEYQSETLERYQRGLESAGRELYDLQTGFRVVGDSAEDQAEAIEKAHQKMRQYQAAIDALNIPAAELATAHYDLKVNVDAAHDALYAAASAAGADASQLALLGLALGDLTPAQAEAALQAAALQAKITELGQAIAEGLDPTVALNRLNLFMEHMNEAGSTAGEATTHINDTQQAMIDLGETPVPPIKITVDNDEALAKLQATKRAVQDYGYTSYTAALDAEIAARGGAATQNGVPVELRPEFESVTTALTKDIPESVEDVVIPLKPDSEEVDNKIDDLESNTVYVPVVFVPQNEPRPGGGGGGSRPVPTVNTAAYNAPMWGTIPIPAAVYNPTGGGGGGSSTTGSPSFVQNNTFNANTREAMALARAYADMENRRHMDRIMGRGR